MDSGSAIRTHKYYKFFASDCQQMWVNNTSLSPVVVTRVSVCLTGGMDGCLSLKLSLPWLSDGWPDSEIEISRVR